MEQDGELHEILDAGGLDLLQEVSRCLLPCSVVDLSYLFSQGAEENHNRTIQS